MTKVVQYDAKGAVLRFEAWNRVKNREGLFTRPYRKNYTHNGVSSLFRRVVIPKGHYSENNIRVIIPKIT